MTDLAWKQQHRVASDDESSDFPSLSETHDTLVVAPDVCGRCGERFKNAHGVLTHQARVGNCYAAAAKRKRLQHERAAKSNKKRRTEGARRRADAASSSDDEAPLPPSPQAVVRTVELTRELVAAERGVPEGAPAELEQAADELKALHDEEAEFVSDTTPAQEQAIRYVTQQLFGGGDIFPSYIERMTARMMGDDTAGAFAGLDRDAFPAMAGALIAQLVGVPDTDARVKAAARRQEVRRRIAELQARVDDLAPRIAALAAAREAYDAHVAEHRVPAATAAAFRQLAEAEAAQ